MVLEISTYPNGCILYDGSCGVCTTFVGRRAKFFNSHGFQVSPFQEPWVGELFPDKQVEFNTAIHLIGPHGKLFSGMKVYQEVLRTIWWGRPLYFLMRLPVISSFFDWGYRLIAKRRHRLSTACGLGHSSKIID